MKIQKYICIQNAKKFKSNTFLFGNVKKVTNCICTGNVRQFPKYHCTGSLEISKMYSYSECQKISKMNFIFAMFGSFQSHIHIYNANNTSGSTNFQHIHNHWSWQLHILQGFQLWISSARKLPEVNIYD